MRNKLAVSILNADFSCLKDVLFMLEENKADLIHLDVMDGLFVPNITFGPKMIETVRENTSLPLSVHLMIEQPERFIEVFAGVMQPEDCLIVHAEACKHLDSVLQQIIDFKLLAGVALNPSTSLDSVKYIMDKMNTLLIMTVNPGFGGQKFLPSMITKIRDFRKITDISKKSVNIQVDGGINLRNLLQVNQAGANILVVGSEIFKDPNPDKIIAQIRRKLLCNHEKTAS